VKQATRELDMARQRAGIDASPRVIMNWFNDPADNYGKPRSGDGGG
jgi:hypothetical protein